MTGCGLKEQIALAEGLLEQRRLGEAVAAFDTAERMGAEADGCSAARWMAAMLLGDFEAAWRESDAIRRRGAPDVHRFWMGESLRGKRVVVRCLHGLGDAIQFLRYVPRLNAIVGSVMVEVPPRLLALTPMLDGVGEVFTWGEEAPAKAPVWDVQIEVMELPYLFRTTEAELPVATRYLRLPEDVVRGAAAVMGAARRPRVGLVWVAGEWNPLRSVPVECLEGLVSLEGVDFWSLQGGEAASDAAAWLKRNGVRDAAVCGDGLPALAAAIANLDLVISVDTLAVHIAGAMGKPIWVLLQRAADWRWMAQRCDSPWYPEATLFRQREDGDWGELVGRVRRQLESWVGGRAAVRGRDVA